MVNHHHTIEHRRNKMAHEKTLIWNDLPNELHLYIFSFMQTADLLKWMRVNRRSYQQVYRQLFERQIQLKDNLLAQIDTLEKTQLTEIRQQDLDAMGARYAKLKQGLAVNRKFMFFSYYQTSQRLTHIQADVDFMQWAKRMNRKDNNNLSDVALLGAIVSIFSAWAHEESFVAGLAAYMVFYILPRCLYLHLKDCLYGIPAERIQTQLKSNIEQTTMNFFHPDRAIRARQEKELRRLDHRAFKQDR